MYVCSRERFNPLPPSRLADAPSRTTRWEVKAGDFVIGVVEEIAPGKFKASLRIGFPIEGEFGTREEAEQAVVEEDAKPPF